MAGRHKLSVAEKELKGTLRKHREKDVSPESDLTSDKPTITLTGPAKKIWQRTYKFLKDNDQIGDVDLDGLTAYCYNMAEYFTLTKKADQVQKENEKNIREYKKTDPDIESLVDFISNLPRPDRWHRMANASFERALKLSDRYGFSPSSRQKLKLEGKDDQVDPLKAFLEGTHPSFRTGAEA